MGASSITQLGAASRTTAGTTTLTVPADTRWLIKNIIGRHVSTGTGTANTSEITVVAGGVTVRLAYVSTTTNAGWSIVGRDYTAYAVDSAPGTPVGSAGPRHDNIVLNAGDTINLIATVGSGSLATSMVVSGVAYSLA